MAQKSHRAIKRGGGTRAEDILTVALYCAVLVVLFALSLLMRGEVH